MDRASKSSSRTGLMLVPLSLVFLFVAWKRRGFKYFNCSARDSVGSIPAPQALASLPVGNCNIISSLEIKEKLDARLAETGYCREGYIVLGRRMDRGRSFIRGECKEEATADDREKFTNSDNT